MEKLQAVPSESRAETAGHALNEHELARAKLVNDKIGAAATKLGFLRASYLEAEQAAYQELHAARLELRKVTEAVLTSRGLEPEGTWEFDLGAGQIKRRD